MVQAVWNDQLIAKSDDTIVIENNHYFPIDSVTPGVLRASPTTSVCPWKGTAHYYSLNANGAENRDAAWFYPEPKNAAQSIKGRVAFWKGVKIT